MRVCYFCQLRSSASFSTCSYSFVAVSRRMACCEVRLPASGAEHDTFQHPQANPVSAIPMGRLPVRLLLLPLVAGTNACALASVTMGIRGMSWDEWIELDRDFAHTHRVCEYRTQTRGEKLVQVHPTQPGVVESGHAAGTSSHSPYRAVSPC